MKILLDQGIPRTAAALLRRRELDAVHTGECGLATATDPEILEYARRHDRVVVTLDADFHTILAVAGEVAPSGVRVRIEGLKAEAMAALVADVVELCTADLEAGAAVSVTSGGVRLRRLPVGTGSADQDGTWPAR